MSSDSTGDNSDSPEKSRVDDSVAQTETWPTVEDPQGRYSLRIPKAPGNVRDSGFFATPGPGLSLWMKVVPATDLKDSAVLSDWNVFEASGSDPAAVEKLLLARLDTLNSRGKTPSNSTAVPVSYSVKTKERLLVDGIPGLDVILTDATGHRATRSRMFLTPTTLYEVKIKGTTVQVESGMTQALLDSLRFTPAALTPAQVASAPATTSIPDDLPVPEKADVETVINNEKMQFIMARLPESESREKVLEFYREQLPAKGWTLGELEKTTGGDPMLRFENSQHSGVVKVYETKTAPGLSVQIETKRK
ncbi:MAG: hypothetical protein ACK5Q5_03115 [Planctomycetaceae bacterium]